MGGTVIEYYVLAVASSEIMLACGLIATLLAESPAARWLLLIYGVFFFCIIVYLINRRFVTENHRATLRKKANAEHMRSAFTLAANYTVIIWLMYPIFWILADGLNQIDDNSSVIAFSILDLASKIGFSAIFFSACKKPPNWIQSLVTFQRTAPAEAISQQPQPEALGYPTFSPVAEVAINAAADSAAASDFSSPVVHVRKVKSTRCAYLYRNICEWFMCLKLLLPFDSIAAQGEDFRQLCSTQPRDLQPRSNCAPQKTAAKLHCVSPAPFCWRSDLFHIIASLVVPVTRGGSSAAQINKPSALLAILSNAQARLKIFADLFIVQM
jgi:hypothetical protein